MAYKEILVHYVKLQFKKFLPNTETSIFVKHKFEPFIKTVLSKSEFKNFPIL